MKVGTDGCLLGAWCMPLTQTPQSILDVGTGTGVIAMMLAQRFPTSRVSAIEIDAEAARQASDNISNGWRPNTPHAPISVIHSSFDNWLANTSFHSFDLIVSNPPFFDPLVNAITSPNPARATARHNSSALLEHLLHSASDLLSPEGCLCVIVPTELRQHCIVCARSLSLIRCTEVFTTQQRATPKRLLLQFTHNSTHTPLTQDKLVIHADNGLYSSEYQSLLSPFYLHF